MSVNGPQISGIFSRAPRITATTTTTQKKQPSRTKRTTQKR